MWVDNEDGTYTAQKGDTLWSLQEKTGKSWDSFGYEGDPTKLQIGETVGKKIADVKTDSTQAGVNINLFPTSERIYGSANKVKNESGVFLIGGHGNWNVMWRDTIKVQYQNVRKYT